MMNTNQVRPTSEPRYLWQRLWNSSTSLVLVVFLVHLLLVYYEFLPNLSDINKWDEAFYINWGRFLAEGRLPPLAENPLMAVFYCLTYLPFMDSPYWLVQSCGLGRFLLFTLLWLGSFLVVRRMSDIVDRDLPPPNLPLKGGTYVLLGMVFVSPVITNILSNPSDAMFAAMSAFGLWQFLLFYQNRQQKNLLGAVLFVSLAALARSDGIALFAILMVLAAGCMLFFPLAKEAKGGIWTNGKTLLISALPFVVLVGGYVVGRGLITGDFESGIASRSYIAFEQGHGLVFAGEDERADHLGSDVMDVRRIFGTPDENDHSVMRAILRNPGAYLNRLQAILKWLPVQLLDAYHKKLAALLFLLALRGVWELFRRKKYALLLVLLVWPGYLAIYFMTFFRAGYLLTPFFVLFSLAAFGLIAMLQNFSSRLERSVWSVVLLILAAYGYFFDKLAIYYGAFVFLAALWLVFYLLSRFSNQREMQQVGLAVLLCVGLILRGNFPQPKTYLLGAQAEEQGAKYLSEHFEPGTVVLAGSPGAVWMARMNFVSANSVDIPEMKSSDQYYQWMLKVGVKVIYMDYFISKYTPYLYNLILEQKGKGLERVFVRDEGSVQIFVVKSIPLR